ncbi:hypothetical protein FJD35_10920 [Pseudomonas mandelii]|nr:hypothetical protein FJD35_10920 [Pseudomonas mandelii]
MSGCCSVASINQMWRGSLLPLGREAALNQKPPFIQTERGLRSATAAQSSGSKLPRHMLVQGFRPVRQLHRTRLGVTVRSPTRTPPRP